MHRLSLAALAVAAALLSLSVGHHRAAADGPGTGGRRVMLQDESAGPYLLRVVTSPTPPRVGELYVEVRVTDPQTGDVLTDLDVYTKAEPTEIEAPTVEAQALHDIAPIPTEYAAHLPIEAAGVWRITIDVQGSAGQGRVSFLTRVSGSPAVGAALSVGLPVAGLALLIVLFIWLQRSGEQEAAA